MLFVKKSSSGDWPQAKKIYVKSDANSSWSLVKKAFVKVGSVWTQFWPKSGPYATTVPYFSLDSSGNDIPLTTSLEVSSNIYAKKGIWSANSSSSSITSYTYNIQTSTSSTAGPYTLAVSNTSITDYALINLSSSTYDGKYIILNVTATRGDGISGSESSDTLGFRYFVRRKYAPRQATGGYTSLVSLLSSSQATTTETGGVLLKNGSPFSFEYTNTWDGTNNYLPDSTRSSIKWYSSTNGTYTTSAQVESNATLITSGTTVSTPSSNGTLYPTQSTLTTGSSVPTGTYYYVVDTQLNSYTDFYSTYGTSIVTMYGPVNTSPTPTVQPTITATTPSGYGGNANSFTVGATVTGNIGTWSPAPSFTQSAYSDFKYSSVSSISNQSNWHLIYGTGGTPRALYIDTSNNQTHSFTLEASTYTFTGAFNATLIGNYIEYSVLVNGGGGDSSQSEFYTNSHLIYDVPYVTDAPGIAYQTATSAEIVAQISSGKKSYAYQLQFSTNNSSWSNVGSQVNWFNSINSGIAVGQTYTGLSTSKGYYRFLSYNGDGVTIPSASTYYDPTTYSFSFGNTLYVSTNGYIGFDYGYSVINVSDTLGKVLAFLNRDLVQDYLSYAAVSNAGDGNQYWLILWQGHRYGLAGTAEIKAEIWIPRGTDFTPPVCFVQYTFSSGIGTTLSATAGFYNNGVAVSGGYGTLYTGSYTPSYQFSLSPNTSSLNLTSWSFKGNTWGGWTTLTGASSISSGTTDDGYYTMVTRAPDGAGAPGASAGSITATTAMITYSAPSDNGGSSISYYEYSTDGGAWTVPFSNPFPVSSLTSGASHTVRIRANNYGYGASTNYGSVTFNTLSLYTVTFNANGGTGSASPTSATQSTAGGTVTLASVGTLAKSGYVFSGWSTTTSGSSIGSAGATYTPASDITLYAVWQTSATAVTSLSATTTDSDKITLTWSGGSGDGYQIFYSNVNASNIPSAHPSSTYDFYSTTSPKEVLAGLRGLYRRFWVRAYTGTVSSPATVSDWYPISTGNGILGYEPLYAPNTPTSPTTSSVTRTNITFSWTAPSTDGTHDSATSYDYYTSNSNSIPASPTGNTALTSVSFTYTASSTPAAQYFWVKAKNADNSSGTTSSITATPIAVYTVTYNGNGNTGGSAPSDSSTYNSGSTVTVLTNSGSLTKTGSSFSKWNTAADGSGTDYNTGATFTISSNITLYAKWTLNTYTITYGANGATSGSAPASQTKTYGTDITLRSNSGTLAKTGSTFSGWNTATDGSGTDYAVSATYTTNSALSLYAKWTLATPSAATITSGTKSTSSVSIVVTYGTNTTDVKVGWATSAASAITATHNSVASGGSSGPIGPLSPSTTYYWHAIPYNSTQAGTAQTGSETTNALPPSVSVPASGPTASRVSAGVINGVWGGSTYTNASFSHYNTRIRRVSTGGTTTHVLTGTTRSDNFTGLTSGQSYVFGVQIEAISSIDGTTKVYSVGTTDQGAYTESGAVNA